MDLVRHFRTVHLPIYIGVVCVFASTAWALVDALRRSTSGVALPIAFAGALLAVVGEAWHAYTHLQLSTHSGPLAAALAFLGVTTVVIAVWRTGRRGRGRATKPTDERRAA